MSYIDWRDAGTSALDSLPGHSRPDYPSGTSAFLEHDQRETRGDPSKHVSGQWMRHRPGSQSRARRLSLDDEAYFVTYVTLSGGDHWHRTSEDLEQSTSAFHSRLWVTRSGDAAGASSADPHSQKASQTAIHELRRLSGLTWDKLAQLFGVDRRSLHHWGSGQPLSRKNEERLNRLLAVIRHIDRGAGDLNRQALLAPTADNIHPFDLLARGEYDEAKKILGRGPGRQEIRRKPLSPEAQAARYPVFTPEELVDARHEPVHVEKQGSRVPRVTRSKKTR